MAKIKEIREVVRKLDIDDFEGDIEHIIDMLQSIEAEYTKKEYSDLSITHSIEYGYGDEETVYFEVFATREETSNEKKKRLEKKRKARETKKENEEKTELEERVLFERLKAKFGADEAHHALTGE